MIRARLLVPMVLCVALAPAHSRAQNTNGVAAAQLALGELIGIEKASKATTALAREVLANGDDQTVRLFMEAVACPIQDSALDAVLSETVTDQLWNAYKFRGASNCPSVIGQLAALRSATQFGPPLLKDSKSIGNRLVFEAEPSRETMPVEPRSYLLHVGGECVSSYRVSLNGRVVAAEEFESTLASPPATALPFVEEENTLKVDFACADKNLGTAVGRVGVLEVSKDYLEPRKLDGGWAVDQAVISSPVAQKQFDGKSGSVLLTFPAKVPFRKAGSGAPAPDHLLKAFKLPSLDDIEQTFGAIHHNYTGRVAIDLVNRLGLETVAATSDLEPIAGVDYALYQSLMLAGQTTQDGEMIGDGRIYLMFKTEDGNLAGVEPMASARLNGKPVEIVAATFTLDKEGEPRLVQLYSMAGFARLTHP